MLKTELEPSAGRTYRIAAVLAVAGTVGSTVIAGAPGGLGFALGAVFSVLNFHLWHRTVRRVGAGISGGGMMFGLRYIGFALAGYAILNYFEANVLAALVGCFVAVAAVLVEILLELASTYKKHGT